MLVMDYLNGSSWLVCPFHGQAVRLKRKSRKKKLVVRKTLYTGGGTRSTKFACGCTFECDC
jgi:hypothetical protein